MKQILIVDDDVSIGDMLEEILTKEGYGVSRAYSGTGVFSFILFLRNRIFYIGPSVSEKPIHIFPL